MTSQAKHDPEKVGQGWSEKRKGNALIHTHPLVDGAVVDRCGLGISAAAGANVTWNGQSFPDVAQAKTAALASVAKAPDAGMANCRSCGTPYSLYGDGFDGECPDCADKTDQELHPENYADDEDGEPAVEPRPREFHPAMTTEDIAFILKMMARLNQSGSNDLSGRLEALLAGGEPEGSRLYTYDFLILTSVSVRADDEPASAALVKDLMNRVKIVDPETATELTLIDVGSLKFASVEG